MGRLAASGGPASVRRYRFRRAAHLRARHAPRPPRVHVHAPQRGAPELPDTGGEPEDAPSPADLRGTAPADPERHASQRVVTRCWDGTAGPLSSLSAVEADLVT